MHQIETVLYDSPNLKYLNKSDLIVICNFISFIKTTVNHGLPLTGSLSLENRGCGESRYYRQATSIIKISNHIN